jgi:hypothetical protein
LFARRAPEHYEPNALARALERRRAAGLEILDLTVSNPTRAGIEYPEEEILAALHDRRALRYEPEARGWIGAREAVARHHAAQGFAADPKKIVLAASTSELYGWLFMLLCEPGETVLAPRPSYPLFECLAGLECVRVEQYRLEEALEWAPDFEGLEEMAGRRGVKAIVHVNPNNPAGSFLKKHDWTRMQELAARRGLALIVDEVFYDFAWGEDGGRTSSLAGPHGALTFTLSGLSKAAGMPQMKLGWVVVNGPEELARPAIERLEWIADSFLSVSAPVQYAAPRWLELAAGIRRNILDRVLANRGILPFETHSEGGWSSLLDLPKTKTEQQWALELLEREGVLVQPGFFYDFGREAIAVASLLAPPAGVREAARRIEGMAAE